MIKRILVVHHGKGIGGASKSASMVVKRLLEIGHKVTVLFLFDSEAKSLFEGADIQQVSIPTYYFNHTSRWYKIHEIHKIIIQMVSWLFTVCLIAPFYIKKHKPEVIYLNSSVLSDWSLSAKFFKVRNVVHIREAISNGYFGLRKYFLKNVLDFSASHIIYLSKHNYNCIRAGSSKHSIIHNYVSENTATVSEERKFDIIYVGGEKGIKGIDLLIEFLEMNKKYSICLLGYYSESFNQKYVTNDKVHIVGVVNNPLDYIARSRLLLFLATTPHFPRPIIEAMSVRTIALSSRLVGIEEVIREGIDGIVLKSNDIDSLNSQIGDVLDNCDAGYYLDNAYDTYIQRFSIENERRIVDVIEL